MLIRGSSGEEVEKMQINLSRLGYRTKADGEFGPKTEANLMSFQYDNGLKVDGIYGPITKRVVETKVSEIPKPVPLPVSESETPWMDWLERNKGEKEIWGTKANPFIVDLFRYTSLAGHKLALTDETAWCAALACAALEKNGYDSPHSASAASFDTYGEKSELKYGSIVTFKRSGGSGRHVTFYAGTRPDGKLKCLGGNQSDMLKYSYYSKSDLVSVRWPKKKTTT